MQIEEERVRELEEDETTNTMLDKRFGGGAIEYDGSSSDEGEYRVNAWYIPSMDMKASLYVQELKIAWPQST